MKSVYCLRYIFFLLKLLCLSIAVSKLAGSKDTIVSVLNIGFVFTRIEDSNCQFKLIVLKVLNDFDWFLTSYPQNSITYAYHIR